MSQEKQITVGISKHAVHQFGGFRLNSKPGYCYRRGFFRFNWYYQKTRNPMHRVRAECVLTQRCLFRGVLLLHYLRRKVPLCTTMANISFSSRIWKLVCRSFPLPLKFIRPCSLDKRFLLIVWVYASHPYILVSVILLFWVPFEAMFRMCMS